MIIILLLILACLYLGKTEGGATAGFFKKLWSAEEPEEVPQPEDVDKCVSICDIVDNLTVDNLPNLVSMVKKLAKVYPQAYFISVMLDTVSILPNAVGTKIIDKIRPRLKKKCEKLKRIVIAATKTRAETKIEVDNQ